jgi:hypothetical protein
LRFQNIHLENEQRRVASVEQPIIEVRKRIHFIRGNWVILDQDLANYFAIETKNLNKAADRNKDRLPESFMFKLDAAEYFELKKCSENIKLENKNRFMPTAYSEHGVLALSLILRSLPAKTLGINLVKAICDVRQNAIAQNFTNLQIQKLEAKIDKLTQLIFNNYFPTHPTSKEDKQETRLNLKSLTSSEKPRLLDSPINKILEAVSSKFPVNRKEILGKSRSQRIALARQVAMYLARNHFQFSYKEIGHFFSGRDHTTVLHACQKIEKYMKSDPHFKNIIIDLKSVTSSPKELIDEK